MSVFLPWCYQCNKYNLKIEEELFPLRTFRIHHRYACSVFVVLSTVVLKPLVAQRLKITIPVGQNQFALYCKRQQVSNLLSVKNLILNAKVRLMKISLMVLLIFFSLGGNPVRSNTNYWESWKVDLKYELRLEICLLLLRHGNSHVLDEKKSICHIQISTQQSVGQKVKGILYHT